MTRLVFALFVALFIGSAAYAASYLYAPSLNTTPDQAASPNFGDVNPIIEKIALAKTYSRVEGRDQEVDYIMARLDSRRSDILDMYYGAVPGMRSILVIVYATTDSDKYGILAGYEDYYADSRTLSILSRNHSLSGESLVVGTHLADKDEAAKIKSELSKAYFHAVKQDMVSYYEDSIDPFTLLSLEFKDFFSEDGLGSDDILAQLNGF